MVEKNVKDMIWQKNSFEGAKDKWNKDQMKQLDFINKRLCEENKARAYINNTNEAMLEYRRISAKK